MATLVLVHGGSHGGWCWQPLARLLRRAGHEVHAPTLTGLADRAHLLSPDVDLETHVEDVVNLLHYEDLHEVILVGHSYGGMVITGVADRALSRIGHIVYLDSAHPRDGEALVDTAPGFMEGARATLHSVDGTEVVLGATPEFVAMMGVTDPAQVAWMMQRLTPHPWRCMTQPLRLVNEAAIRRIPFTNINATWSLERREAESKARCLEGERVWNIDSGHDLMLTETQLLAELLLRLAD